MDKRGFATRAIHGKEQHHHPHGSLAVPIYQTSTYTFQSVEEGGEKFAGRQEGFIYSRLGNPTVQALEERVAFLEGAEKGLAFGSGMAAVSSVLMAFLKAGDHVLCSKGLYGCTFDFLQQMNEKYGVTFSLAPMIKEEELRKEILPSTKIIYIETPMNPSMEMVDLKLAGRLAKEMGILLIVDNTFMTPYFQNPIQWGADLVIHSATKYLGGHGDVVAGVVVGKKELMEQVKVMQKDVGGILGPQDAFLLLRGLKTLALRMEKHNENGMLVAQFLENHPKVKKVYYPGLPSFEQHELAIKQMTGFGGVIAFEMEGGMEQAIKFVNTLKMISIAVSLGDVETLIQHPASMTHAVVPKEKREEMGITDGLIRLAVGIEEAEDIIADIKQALQ